MGKEEHGWVNRVSHGSRRRRGREGVQGIKRNPAATSDGVSSYRISWQFGQASPLIPSMLCSHCVQYFTVTLCAIGNDRIDTIALVSPGCRTTCIEIKPFVPACGSWMRLHVMC